jgi:hypothetical protein
MRVSLIITKYLLIIATFPFFLLFLLLEKCLISVLNLAKSYTTAYIVTNRDKFFARITFATTIIIVALSVIVTTLSISAQNYVLRAIYYLATDSKIEFFQTDFARKILEIPFRLIQEKGLFVAVVISFVVPAFAFVMIKLINHITKSGKNQNKAIKSEKMRKKAKKKGKICVGKRLDNINVKDKRSAGKYININPAQLGKHQLILGATGSGKTESILITQIVALLNMGKSCIFLDPKGSEKTFKKITNIINSNIDCHFLNLGKPQQSSSYNPLALGIGNSKQRAIQKTNKIMNSLTWGDGNATHYKNRAKQVLSIVIESLEDAGENYNLKDLYFLLDNQEALELLADKITDISISLKRRFEKKIIDEKIENDISGLIAQLEDFLAIESVIDTYNADIDLAKIHASKKTQFLYVTLPKNLIGESATAFGRMLLADLKLLTGLIENGELQRKDFYCYIDEFSGGLVSEEFVQWLNKARSASISITMATQSISDLEEFGEHIKKQIITNTNIKHFLKQDAAIDELMEIIGTIEEKKITTQLNNNTFSDSESEMGTMREVESFVVSPNIFRNQLEIGQGLTIIKNPRYSIDAVQYDYYQDPEEVKEVELYRNQEQKKGLNIEKKLLEIDEKKEEKDPFSEEKKEKNKTEIKEKDPFST